MTTPLQHDSTAATADPGAACAIVLPEANTGVPLKGEDFQRMARRRFQNPKPKRRGHWWYIQVRRDVFVGGRLRQKNKWEKIAPASRGEREVNKVAAEHLRPLNQGLENIGSATNFRTYVETTYKPVEMPLLASTTRERYEGVIENYLYPAFGNLCLRDLTPLSVQRYFSGLAESTLSHESKDKIRDVLSSILSSAVKYGMLVKNPVEGVRLPHERRGRRKLKRWITCEQFDYLLARMPEPYATMVYVAVWSALRISELIGLRWEDVRCWVSVDEEGQERVRYGLCMDERYCRGDWAEPKSEASNAMVDVPKRVYERIHRLKLLTVTVRAGRAQRRYKVVKADGPTDLVFQSVKDGKPMRDNNILVRFIKPAARAIGLPWINWLCLRTSCATWMIESWANPKDVQAQMRHSRTSTTMDIYAQFVTESQRRAISRMVAMVDARQAAQVAAAPGQRPN